MPLRGREDLGKEQAELSKIRGEVEDRRLVTADSFARGCYRLQAARTIVVGLKGRSYVGTEFPEVLEVASSLLTAHIDDAFLPITLLF